MLIRIFNEKEICLIIKQFFRGFDLNDTFLEIIIRQTDRTTCVLFENFLFVIVILYLTLKRQSHLLLTKHSNVECEQSCDNDMRKVSYRSSGHNLWKSHRIAKVKSFHLDLPDWCSGLCMLFTNFIVVWRQQWDTAIIIFCVKCQ